MRVAGRARVPGDKSITHRALLVAALARGTSEIEDALVADDARSTAAVLRMLGVTVSDLCEGRPVRVGGGVPGIVREPAIALDCGNSGTTARLITGLLSGVPVTARITGDASLRRRPMRRVTEPLRRMGASIVEANGDGLPLVVTGGPLRPLRHESPVASAQVKGALLLAGLVGRAPVSVTEPFRSRDHTERMLDALGLPVRIDERTVSLDPPASPVDGFRLRVPGDVSSAAFLAVAAVLADAGSVLVEGVGLNPTRTGFLTVLRRMGATIRSRVDETVVGEPVGTLAAEASALEGTVVEAREIPWLIDEVPVLAVAAATARGETVFRGVGELRVKESDRLGLLARNLSGLGVPAVVLGDALTITGVDRPLAGRIDTGHDHRMAMAFAVLGTRPGSDIRLSETESPRISYPRFFDDLERIEAR